MDQKGNVIRRVRDIDRVKALATEGKARFAVGGMISKLEAVKMAVEAGIPTAIINGRQPDRIAAIVAGEQAGTRFVARQSVSRTHKRKRQ